MAKRVIILLCVGIIFPVSTFARRYPGKHFLVESNLDSRLVDIVQKRAEAFYTNLSNDFSLRGWLGQLTIYYSKNEAQTNQLLSKYGFVYLKGNSYYITGSPSIYIHLFDENGKPSDRGLLFKGITRHFIAQNLNNAPGWFSEGLSSFFAEQSEIVNDKLVVSPVIPNNNTALKEKIDRGSRPNIKQLFSMTQEQLHGLEYGCQMTREFFYWLYDTDQLAAYLKNVQKQGFELSVLEKTVSKNFGKINLELLDFLNKSCYAEAHFSDALGTDDPNKKQETLFKTLELQQDYHKARIELIKHFHKADDLQKCKDHLDQILNAPVSPEHMSAAVLMGNLYYKEKDYSKAIEYYTRAWNYSTNYDGRYRIAYRIANSYNHLKNTTSARKWYQTFLTSKWNSNDMTICADYAQKYVDYARRIEKMNSSRKRRPSTRPQPSKS
ncbi:MAG: tetratricopeptide repeat protein [Planctomycetota bacterium]|jgi:tetratricopeptide (TPR) repeat protein